MQTPPIKNALLPDAEGDEGQDVTPLQTPGKNVWIYSAKG
jgi:hypothetical protein